MTATLAPFATPRILRAVRARLIGDALLTERLTSAPAELGGGPGIYTEGYVPVAARTDYLTIGPFTEVSDDAMGDGAKWGSNVTMQIKLVTQSKDIGYSFGTADRLMALLHGVTSGQGFVVEDYVAASCQLETAAQPFAELFAGTEYRHYPMIWRVRVHQPR